MCLGLQAARAPLSADGKQWCGVLVALMMVLAFLGLVIPDDDDDDASHHSTTSDDGGLGAGYVLLVLLGIIAGLFCVGVVALAWWEDQGRAWYRAKPASEKQQHGCVALVIAIAVLSVVILCFVLPDDDDDDDHSGDSNDDDSSDGLGAGWVDSYRPFPRTVPPEH